MPNDFPISDWLALADLSPHEHKLAEAVNIACAGVRDESGNLIGLILPPAHLAQVAKSLARTMPADTTIDPLAACSVFARKAA